MFLEDQFQEIVLKEMERRNISYETLAAKMRMSADSVKQLLQTEARLTADVMQRFFRALDLQPRLSAVPINGVWVGDIMSQEQFRSIVAKELKKRGVPHLRLAGYLALPVQHVRDYLTGATAAPPEVIERFFNALGLATVVSIHPRTDNDCATLAMETES